MPSEVAPVSAETEPSSAEKTNISPEDFAIQRLGQLQAREPQKAPPQEEAKEAEATPSPEEDQAVESSDEPEVEKPSKDVLSNIDLDEMSEEELRELADKLGSRAVARFGELTAKRKAAEARLQALEAEMSKENPLQPKEPVKDNPYANIDTLESLQSKSQEVNQVIEWAEEVLFNADSYAADDYVTEVEGKSLTKAEVRRTLVNARKSRDKFLPAQLEVLQAKEHGVRMRQTLEQQAVKELDWMSKEDSEVKKRYEAMISDPRLAGLEKALPPDISAQLPYLLAHAANSMYGRRLIQDTSQSIKLTPSKTAVGAAAAPDRGEDRKVKAIKDISQRFQKSGDKGDFIALRTLQLQTRR
jgi:hypothetical protein